MKTNKYLTAHEVLERKNRKETLMKDFFKRAAKITNAIHLLDEYGFLLFELTKPESTKTSIDYPFFKFAHLKVMAALRMYLQNNKGELGK